jgi:competence protein ComEC
VHVACLALTSALAGTFSMPYGAYHFGRIQVYFVVSNMVAVPLTALWVMPAGLVGLLLMPLGLDWLAFIPMGWGAEAILWVARTATALPASTLDVPHMPAWGLGAVAAIAVGVASPALERPPDLLVSADARLIAMRTSAGVFMQSTGGAQRFTRDAWLQYWGGGEALPLPGGSGEAGDGAVSCARDACLLQPRPGVRGALLARGGAGDWCRSVGIVVSAEPARGLCPRPWPALVDRFTVWRQGAAAIWLQPTGRARVLTDREARGARPWVPPPPEPRSKEVPAGLPPAARDGSGGG